MTGLFEKILLKVSSLKDQNNYKRFLTRSEVARINQNSLLFYFGNIHSQRGQDGILAEIFRRLKIKEGLFVEFGAWDGMYLCNSRWLYEKGWAGVFIEAKQERFEKLCRVYANDRNIVKINAMVGAPRQNVLGKSLGELLNEQGVPSSDVTFVSIDVDGPDLEIFSEIGFKPPVILLEGGFNFSPYFDERISPELAWKNIQQPLPVIFATAIELGYVPVCFYQDTFLVRSDLAEPFADCAGDAIQLFSDAFRFMPNDYRQALLDYRENSEIIRKLEKDHFGKFFTNPLEYENAELSRF